LRVFCARSSRAYEVRRWRRDCNKNGTVPRRPILVHSIVSANGSQTRHPRVFCSRLAQSLSLEDCRACPAFLVEKPSQEGEVIECRPDGPGPGGAPPASFGRSHAGAIAACSELVCVHGSVNALAVMELLHEERIPFVLVLDDDGRVVGAVWPSALIEDEDATARDVMTNHGATEESSSVRAALLQMASSHRRYLPVVAGDGSPVGVVRDVDALRAWTRRAQEDEEEV
jgi:hypothetical protein